MSSLKIEERFHVDADPDRVFAFLTDPERLAPCMPGAELERIETERRFHGNVKRFANTTRIFFTSVF